MSTQTYHGHLLLADISGYTAYLAGVELDHAHNILANLRQAILGRLKAVFPLSNLEAEA